MYTRTHTHTHTHLVGLIYVYDVDFILYNLRHTDQHDQCRCPLIGADEERAAHRPHDGAEPPHADRGDRTRAER